MGINKWESAVQLAQPTNHSSFWLWLSQDTLDFWASLLAQTVKNLLAIQETRARSLGWEDPFSRGSSQPRDWTQVSCIAGRFFSSWATREVQEYWSGWPIPSPADLPNPGIKLGSLALQVDYLPTELSGKPIQIGYISKFISIIWSLLLHSANVAQK